MICSGPVSRGRGAERSVSSVWWMMAYFMIRFALDNRPVTRPGQSKGIIYCNCKMVCPCIECAIHYVMIAINFIITFNSLLSLSRSLIFFSMPCFSDPFFFFVLAERFAQFGDEVIPHSCHSAYYHRGRILEQRVLMKTETYATLQSTYRMHLRVDECGCVCAVLPPGKIVDAINLLHSFC